MAAIVPAPKRKYFKSARRKAMGKDETPLYKPNGDLFPRSLEYTVKCVEIVETWLYVKDCRMDELLERLGLNASETHASEVGDVRLTLTRPNGHKN
jgi:hypothetical protein